MASIPPSLVEGVEQVLGLHANDGDDEVRRELRELVGRWPHRVAVVRRGFRDERVRGQFSWGRRSRRRCHRFAVRLAGRHFDIACACPHGDGVGCSCAAAASVNLDDAGLDRGAEGDEGEAKDREGSGAYSRMCHGSTRCKGQATVWSFRASGSESRNRRPPGGGAEPSVGTTAIRRCARDDHRALDDDRCSTRASVLSPSKPTRPSQCREGLRAGRRTRGTPRRIALARAAARSGGCTGRSEESDRASRGR